MQLTCPPGIQVVHGLVTGPIKHNPTIAICQKVLESDVQNPRNKTFTLSVARKIAWSCNTASHEKTLQVGIPFKHETTPGRQNSYLSLSIMTRAHHQFRPWLASCSLNGTLGVENQMSGL